MHDVSTNADYFYAQDGLGTIRGIYDISSAVVNDYDYEGFGTSLNATETIYNRFRYTGREIDIETQTTDSTALYYYRARTYDITIGSFLSRDPIPASNLYKYCESNPTNNIDPLGLYKLHTMYSKSDAEKKWGKLVEGSVPDWAFDYAFANSTWSWNLPSGDSSSALDPEDSGVKWKFFGYALFDNNIIVWDKWSKWIEEVHYSLTNKGDEICVQFRIMQFSVRRGRHQYTIACVWQLNVGAAKSISRSVSSVVTKYENPCTVLSDYKYYQERMREAESKEYCFKCAENDETEQQKRIDEIYEDWVETGNPQKILDKAEITNRKISKKDYERRLEDD